MCTFKENTFCKCLTGSVYIVYRGTGKALSMMHHYSFIQSFNHVAAVQCINYALLTIMVSRNTSQNALHIKPWDGWPTTAKHHMSPLLSTKNKNLRTGQVNLAGKKKKKVKQCFSNLLPHDFTDWIITWKSRSTWDVPVRVTSWCIRPISFTLVTE